MTTDPATAYARGVVKGKIVAGRLVRLACERHLRDLKEGPARGLRWDGKAAARVLAFFACLRLPDRNDAETGAALCFTVQPSQAFILGSIFGWKRVNGKRRFQTAYIEEGKGNGKTPLVGGIGAYGLVGDGEEAPEIYCAATKFDQAMICFTDAKRIMERTPALARRLADGIGKRNIADAISGGFLRPVSSDHRGASGPRPHMNLFDEIHEMEGSDLIAKMRAGVKSRTQPLNVEITNSGFDRHTVCWEHHEYSEKVLRATTPDAAGFDDSWFAYVCTLDPCPAHIEEGKGQPVEGCSDCDDWRDEATWEKANPCLGAIITRDYLREQVKSALGRPSEEGKVKRLNFCIWTEGETAWLPVELWSRGARKFDPADLAGRECYGGLDMASKIDVAAFVLCFPDFPEEGMFAWLARFWIPEATAEIRQARDGVPWRLWERQGLVTLTPGDVIDPEAVAQEVEAAFQRYFLHEVRYDPWNATQMALQLQGLGVKMIEFGQTLKNFNEPCKLLESLLREGKLIHGGNPVLNWMASNVVVYTDANDNIRPLKPEHHSPKKVDGIVAGVMALAGALAQLPSVYDTRGVTTLDGDPEPQKAEATATPEASAWREMWRDDAEED